MGRKLRALAIVTLAVVLTGCGKSVVSEQENLTTEANFKTITSEPTSEALKDLSPEIISGRSGFVSFKLPQTNGEVRVYVIEYGSEIESEKRLVFEESAENLSTNEIGTAVSFDEETVISNESFLSDDFSIECGYYYKALQIGCFDGNAEYLSEVYPIEVYLNTDTVDQYKAALAGSTACGAAAGTLLLQTIMPVYGDELISRMSLIRDCCDDSDDYSTGAPKYYMSGEQIANCLNRFLEENGSEQRFGDFRTEESTEQTLLSLISSGRAAVLEVCYYRGIVESFSGYSHWIAVNGFRKTESGTEFRYENTIGCTQGYISAESLTNANDNVQYPGFSLEPTGYIVALENL